ncbi:hypothetical protein L2E82_28106 [Cichorium intybus]|uniref:Uncharacterized protein n=1 Tax=Cichorium intybus TaxID=13427 RepID=A0ACB9CV72_CICIN|nr:hypothetical protein L2E82_28106 [Cichorium intybus]
MESGNLRPEIVQGLIDFLDHHNELIKLLRTARNLSENNVIPEFSIRLYSLVGAQQYELPTADMLGAIDFENGQTTKTDYDIIITLKDGTPQRINKLHPSYMSLQFPLIFIYGQPGFQTSMKLINPGHTTASGSRQRLTMNIMSLSFIADLRPKDKQKVIEAKVYRTWISRYPPDPTPQGYYCILLDKMGHAIQANMDFNDMEHFKQIMKQDQAYKISNFICEETKLRQRTLPNPTTLRFGRFTSFENIPGDAFPQHHFNFVSYNQLHSKLAKDSILTDQLQLQLCATAATHYYINPEIEEVEQSMPDPLDSHVREQSLKSLITTIGSITRAQFARRN